MFKEHAGGAGGGHGGPAQDRPQHGEAPPFPLLHQLLPHHQHGAGLDQINELNIYTIKISKHIYT